MSNVWGVTHPPPILARADPEKSSSSIPQCGSSGKEYSAGFITAPATISMIALDPIIFRELPAIHQIILNETWLEAERRGCCVYPNDRVVRDNVCQVVLRIGAQLRRTAEQAVAESQATDPHPDFPEAA